ncbi:MAG: N-acetylmuramoyl-L-alanine amidase [Rhodobacterales bacterium]|nr:N-acetylmuramoyl-L-alanine amidase [Rhodobacterales bacterium]
MPSAQAALARLCDPAAEVSAHWLVGNDGRLWQLVDESARAWHAGAGEWGGCTDVNSASIGIELDNPGDCPFAAPQMAALRGLLRGVMARWSIPPQGVIGHSDLAPLRKQDPGPRFDWRALAAEGLSVWPADLPAADPAPTDPAALIPVLRRFGYPDVPAGALLAAFRARFRPDAGGPPDARDAALAADLAARFPAARFPVDAAAPGA